MLWQISGYEVTYGDNGTPLISLFSGKRAVATVSFGDRPARRFTVDRAQRTVRIELDNSERRFLMDLLRNEQGMSIDTEDPKLLFRRG